MHCYKQVSLHGLFERNIHYKRNGDEPGTHFNKEVAKLLKCRTDDVTYYLSQGGWLVCGFQHINHGNHYFPEILASEGVIAFKHASPNIGRGANCTHVVMDSNLCRVFYTNQEDLIESLALKLNCDVKKVKIQNPNGREYKLYKDKIRDEKSFSKYPFYYAFASSI